jgi:catechol 2,3-dioxygenase-like lactoylglutathione lyase family enzyme
MALHRLASVTIGVPDIGATAAKYTDFGLAQDTDDLARIAASLSRLGIPVGLDGDDLVAVEPVVGTRTVVRVPPLVQDEAPRATYNGPGRLERRGRRADDVLCTGPIRPTRLGHAVIGTTKQNASSTFFVDGLGFKVSDHIGDKGVSCGAPPSTATCWSSPRRSTSCTTRRGRSPMSTRSAATTSPSS